MARLDRLTALAASTLSLPSLARWGEQQRYNGRRARRESEESQQRTDRRSTEDGQCPWIHLKIRKYLLNYVVSVMFLIISILLVLSEVALAHLSLAPLPPSLPLLALLQREKARGV